MSQVSPSAQSCTINVVVFGATGVGKSSVINLIAQREVAKVPPGACIESFTRETTRHDITFDGIDFAVFDTIGLSDPRMEVDGYLKAIEKAYELITNLSANGGVHLLLFCIWAGPITATTQSNYRLIRETLCGTEVPLALVFTDLEREVKMEDWWTRNKMHIEWYGIRSVGHVCITTVQDDTSGEDLKYVESQLKIRELLKTCALKNEVSLPGTSSWFARLGQGMRVFNEKNQRRPRRDIMRVLTARCKLDPETARKIADMMEKGDPDPQDGIAAGNRDSEAGSTSGSAEGKGGNEDAPDEKLVLLEKTIKQLRTQLTKAQEKAENLAQILHVHEQKHHCETLYAEGRNTEAAESLLEIINTKSEAVKANKLLMDWITDFTKRCISTLERIGDEASNVEEREKAILAYSIFLSLVPPSPRNGVLTKWAQMTLIPNGSAKDVLEASTTFKLPKSIVYQTICDVLEANDRVTEAIMCFRQMQRKQEGNTNVCGDSDMMQWVFGFQRRCANRLEKLGSVAMGSKDYLKAAEHFSTMLLLDSVNRVEGLIKRSRARVLAKMWGDALSDADECIKLEPSSHQGYEMRHAALHGAGRFDEAVGAFCMMLSMLEESPHEHIRELRRQHADATSTVQQTIEETIRDMPLVLIDTTTGRLYDKKQQGEVFKTLPIYNELISSMTTRIDETRIRTEVEEFYRYVMLSHKWEDGEPLLQKVGNVTVYELELSSANMKLRDFCTLVRSLGFRWAWSDTCCVDKDNKRVLEESLVAMFTWYRGSSLTIVYLRGVSSLLQKPYRLRGSLWNTRAWTYQEYVAAKVVQFYTEDWKPYLGLTMFNHKDSPAIISEMQQATAGSAKDITVLHPGLDRVREKLSLASMRKATLVEDTAYSLLGIFNASIPIQYGERDRAVGRLLEYVLTGSRRVTILAWTGRAGSYNSCLPVDFTVYNQVLPPHIPQPIESSEMNTILAALRSSSYDHSQAVKLHDRINQLPSPSSAASRLQLPGILFRLTELVRTSSGGATVFHTYRAKTSIFGDIEIKTVDSLTEKKPLYLIHPWIRTLLDQEFEQGADDLDETMQALRFVARLRQPFGALLVEQLGRMEYRRVAADSLIMVRIRKEVPLIHLTQSIRTIEVQ